jgi:hypothetical protein
MFTGCLYSGVTLPKEILKWTDEQEKAGYEIVKQNDTVVNTGNNHIEVVVTMWAKKKERKDGS